MKQDYTSRKAMMLKRLDVTVQSFVWIDPHQPNQNIKKNKDLLLRSYQQKKRLLSTKSRFFYLFIYFFFFFNSKNKSTINF